MKCEDIKKLLPAFMDGQVTDQQRVRIQSHLDTCESCKQELAILLDLQKKMELAFSMKALPAEPSADSWNRLRQKLEPEPQRSFFGSLANLLAQPAWRVAAAAAVVFLIGIGVVFGTGILPIKQQPANFSAITSTGGVQSPTVPGIASAPPSVESNQPATRDSAGGSKSENGQGQGQNAGPADQPTPAPGPYPSLTIPQKSMPSLAVKWAISTDTFRFGQNIEAKLIVTNISANPQTINGYPPLIEIIKTGMPPETVIRSFPAGKQQAVIDPGKSVEYALVWDQKDNSGQQVTYGRYEIRASVTTANSTSQGSSGSVNILILPAEGTLEKTLEVNKSVTVNGISVTLEKIEFTATSMKVYVFVVPPNYSLPAGPVPPPVTIMINSLEYSFDNGVIRTTNPVGSGIGPRATGIEYSWPNLDPAPKNTKQMLIRIPQIGDKQGPWEFRFSLQ